jgi:hypothetical protein
MASLKLNLSRVGKCPASFFASEAGLQIYVLQMGNQNIHAAKDKSDYWEIVPDFFLYRRYSETGWSGVKYSAVYKDRNVILNLYIRYLYLYRTLSFVRMYWMYSACPSTVPNAIQPVLCTRHTSLPVQQRSSTIYVLVQYNYLILCMCFLVWRQGNAMSVLLYMYSTYTMALCIQARQSSNSGTPSSSEVATSGRIYWNFLWCAKPCRHWDSETTVRMYSTRIFLGSPWQKKRILSARPSGQLYAWANRVLYSSIQVPTFYIHVCTVYVYRIYICLCIELYTHINVKTGQG